TFRPYSRSLLPQGEIPSLCLRTKASAGARRHRTRPLTSTVRFDRRRASAGNVGPRAEVFRGPSTPNWPGQAAKAYDKLTLAEFLKQQGASRGAIQLLEFPFATADNDPSSALWNLREFFYESKETTRSKIKGGNDLLPKAFAAKLSDK